MARFIRAVAGIPAPAARGALAATPGVLDRIDAVLIHAALEDEISAPTKRQNRLAGAACDIEFGRQESHRASQADSVDVLVGELSRASFHRQAH
jgi:hypothetical protein